MSPLKSKIDQLSDVEKAVLLLQGYCADCFCEPGEHEVECPQGLGGTVWCPYIPLMKTNLNIGFLHPTASMRSDLQLRRRKFS